MIMYVLDYDILETGAYGTWKVGNYVSEEPVAFIFFFHEDGRMRFFQNYSPIYHSTQRQFPGNRKRNMPTYTRKNLHSHKLGQVPSTITLIPYSQF
jgi:hypothetical protein